MLVALVLLVGGLTALELASGHAIVAQGDRNTTFFSPKDSTPPTLADVPEAKGSSITLRYNEALRETSVSGRDGFSLAKGPPQVRIVTVSVAGSRVVLTLSGEVVEGIGVRLNYSEGGIVEDTAGNPAPGFAYRVVEVVARPPELVSVSAEVGNGQLTLQFNEPLAAADDDEQLASSLSVGVDGERLDVEHVQLSGDRLVVFLQEPIASVESIDVAYERGETDVLRDSAGNAVESFSRAVTPSGDVTAPTAEELSVSDDELKIGFNEELDSTFPPQPGDFAITSAGVTTPLSGVISGNARRLDTRRRSPFLGRHR